MSSGEEIVGKFDAADYVILSLCLGVSASIGIYHAFAGGGQKTAEEFLLADRSMHPFPVSVSLLASFISAITVLGTPAETYVQGTMYWLFSFAYIGVGIWTSRVFIPVFYKYKITSVNEVSQFVILDQSCNLVNINMINKTSRLQTFTSWV
ncbi:Sodium-coupled monocarboxylate transporter 1 [Holothuria leucospilota]|uniref:Sodium-coupled monocarboxylate transporter 1 n=1 Tax=Holothuria leucospilota TaxID=206669 RepID=A0A9Q0YG46_HOLLE|nr:Sodium-coupled monocarboxylate transporter 1 [Holothuria leucospilota]